MGRVVVAGSGKLGRDLVPASRQGAGALASHRTCASMGLQVSGVRPPAMEELKAMPFDELWNECTAHAPDTRQMQERMRRMAASMQPLMDQARQALQYPSSTSRDTKHGNHRSIKQRPPLSTHRHAPAELPPPGEASVNTVPDTAATDAEAGQPYEVGDGISAPGNARSSHRAPAVPTRTPPVPPARVAGSVAAAAGTSYLTNGSAFRHAPEVGCQGVDVMNVVGRGPSRGLVLWLTTGGCLCHMR